MDQIIVSAPGKVILHGEHAVVYGKRAIATSLDMRTYLRLRLGDDNTIRVELPNINVKIQWDKKRIESSLELPLCPPLSPTPPDEQLLEQLRELAGVGPERTDTHSLGLVSFLYLYCSIAPASGKLPSIDMFLASNLPPSAGLGSSAAYSVCLAASLLQLAGLIPRPSSGETKEQLAFSSAHLELINKWAFQSEKVIHGNPSGIDNSVSTYGGAISFQGGQITPLTRIPKFEILLTNTKVPRSTKKLVSNVRVKFNKYPDVIGPVIESIEAISTRCVELLKLMSDDLSDSHFSEIKELIEMNQHHLCILGVSHSAIDTICQLTAKRGLVSKLTGAGGGGCVFTLLPPGTDKSVLADVVTDLEAQDFSCWRTQIGGCGVSCHSTAQNGLPAFLVES